MIDWIRIKYGWLINKDVWQEYFERVSESMLVFVVGAVGYLIFINQEGNIFTKLNNPLGWVLSIIAFFLVGWLLCALRIKNKKEHSEGKNMEKEIEKFKKDFKELQELDKEMHSVGKLSKETKDKWTKFLAYHQIKTMKP